MFSVGDKILYPMHGAGVICTIEEKEILGEIRRYYSVKLPFDNLTLLIPIDSCIEVGLRPIISGKEVDGVFDVLNDDSSESAANWNKRQRDNLNKLKTGDILKTAEVVRDLIRADRKKRLSTGERKMLNDARRILESELVLASDMDLQKIDDLVEEAV